MNIPPKDWLADVLRVFDEKNNYTGERLRPKQFGYSITQPGEIVVRVPAGTDT